jgi:hypothetical protein
LEVGLSLHVVGAVVGIVVGARVGRIVGAAVERSVGVVVKPNFQAGGIVKVTVPSERLPV